MNQTAEPDIFVRILNKVEKIDQIAADVRVLKTDVGILKTDVGILKTDVGILKTDVGTLKTDVGTLQADVHEIKGILREHTFRLDQLDTAVVEVHQDVMQHSREIAELKSR